MARQKSPRPDSLSDTSVARLLGVHKRTLLRWLQDGLVAEPEGRLAKNRRAWTLAEVDAVRERLQRRDIDTADHIQPARRSGQDHQRHYPRAVLRRQGTESTAA